MESEQQVLQEKLQHLLQWFKENPKLPKEINITLLKRFLKCMNGDIEDTKQLLDINYQLRNKCPHLFIKRDPKDELTKKSFQVVDMVPLPGVTPENYKVLCFRLTEKDVKLQNSTEECKAFFLMNDTRFLYPDVTEDGNNEETNGDQQNLSSLASGEIHIVDIANYSLRHLASMSLTTMRIYMNFLQQAYPVRLKAMHLINCPTFLNRMMAITKPFIHEEVYKMNNKKLRYILSILSRPLCIYPEGKLEMHFHTNGIESLYEYVPRDMLPTEYGGKADSLSVIKTNWWKIIMKNRDYLVDPNHWTIDKTQTKSNFLWW